MQNLTTSFVLEHLDIQYKTKAQIEKLLPHASSNLLKNCIDIISLLFTQCGSCTRRICTGSPLRYDHSNNQKPSLRRTAEEMVTDGREHAHDCHVCSNRVGTWLVFIIFLRSEERINMKMYINECTFRNVYTRFGDHRYL